MSKEQRAKDCVDKLLEATKEHFPLSLMLCSGEDDGFAIMTCQTDKERAKLMARITSILLNSDYLYSTIKEIVKKVDEIKEVN